MGVETWTPTKAKIALARMTGNRNADPSWCVAMAADMRSGAFDPCFDPIILDNEGNCCNGQHRLTGLIRAGVSLDFITIRLNSKADAKRWVMDRTRRRTIANITDMCIRDAAVVNVLTRIRIGREATRSEAITLRGAMAGSIEIATRGTSRWINATGKAAIAILHLSGNARERSHVEQQAEAIQKQDYSGMCRAVQSLNKQATSANSGNRVMIPAWKVYKSLLIENESLERIYTRDEERAVSEYNQFVRDCIDAVTGTEMWESVK
jgi:hypothetical protein